MNDVLHRVFNLIYLNKKIKNKGDKDEIKHFQFKRQVLFARQMISAANL